MEATLLRGLTQRVRALADALAKFVDSPPDSFGKGDAGRMRRAPYLVARVSALLGALDLAEDSDVSTIENELTDLKVLAQTVLPREAPTLRPPPKSSGTFLIEVKTAATNRLLTPTDLDT